MPRSSPWLTGNHRNSLLSRSILGNSYTYERKAAPLRAARPLWTAKENNAATNRSHSHFFPNARNGVNTPRQKKPPITGRPLFTLRKTVCGTDSIQKETSHVKIKPARFRVVQFDRKTKVPLPFNYHRRCSVGWVVEREIQNPYPTVL